MKNTAFTSLITLSLVGVLTAGAALTSFAEENDTSAYFDLEIDAQIPSPEDGDNTIVVGVVPTPHGEVIEQVEDKLEQAGWKVEIVNYEDYVLPNNALDSGELDANYFQHDPYLQDFNEKNGTELSGVAAVHFEPLGIYAGKSEDLASIQEGAVIAIPNDTTNEARALLLLQDNGLITLKEGAGLQATPIDIADNPYHLEFSELEAALTAKVIDDVDFAVVNGNYAINADIKDRLVAVEDAKSEAARTYANLIVVKSGSEETLKTQALVNAVLSSDIRTFINDTYDGAVIAVF